MNHSQQVEKVKDVLTTVGFEAAKKAWSEAEVAFFNILFVAMELTARDEKRKGKSGWQSTLATLFDHLENLDNIRRHLGTYGLEYLYRMTGVKPADLKGFSNWVEFIEELNKRTKHL